MSWLTNASLHIRYVLATRRQPHQQSKAASASIDEVPETKVVDSNPGQQAADGTEYDGKKRAVTGYQQRFLIGCMAVQFL